MNIAKTKGMVLMLAILILCILVPTTTSHAVRIRGSVGADAYGYQDQQGEDHLWLMQKTRFSLYHANNPLSLHFSGGYLGDNHDEFSNSGRGRFLKGYIQYGGLGRNTDIRAGRFFLYRGVALGVMDGIDISHNILPNLKMSVFGGMMGDYSRDFEFEDPSESMSYGAEVKFSSKNCPMPYATKGTVALSYTQQNRADQTLRHRYGLNTNHRFGSNLSWFNTVHMRATEAPLRKWISRLRYNCTKWSAMFEYGLASPDVAEYSWFSGFAEAKYMRIRGAVDYWVTPQKYAVGFELQELIAENGNGFRGGPVVHTPWGQAGYRLAGGDQSNTTGPWVNAHFKPVDPLELYAFGAMVSYEWDAMDIETDDLTMMFAGARFNPCRMPSLQLFAEYQVYQNREFSDDKRARGGITWNFDLKGGGR
ncbi:hypothetical protein K8I28_00140 [bacterium]|nr:hypothetical protein [bacterium]